MKIEPTGEYNVTTNNTYVGTFKLGENEKYTYGSAIRYYNETELQQILDKLLELNKP